MKILHLADIHIGMENYGRIDPTTGLNTRLIDFLERLDEAIDIGLREEVDLVLIAGDIYKNRTPNPTHQREFARRVRRIRDAGVPVFILVGNHDVPAAAGRAHSVEIFETLAIDGVTIADRLRLYRIETRSGPLQMIAVPWISRHAILTKDDVRNLPFGEVDAEILRRVQNWLEHTADTLEAGVPAVLAFHGSVMGATYGAERSVMLGNDLVLPPSALALPGIDYIALGHIHRHQVIGHHPPAVYPGSLERIDFSEEKEEKGVVLVELGQGETRWRFVPVRARPFITIDVDVRASSDPIERIRTAIAKRQIEGAIVRLIVSALSEQRPHIKEDDLQRELEEAGAQFIASISIEIARSSRGRYAAVAQELQNGITPRRALELFLLSKNIPAERMERLLAAADELIKAQQAESDGEQA